MDPDTCLKELRELMESLRECKSKNQLLDLQLEIPEKFEVLDNWIKNGGMLPDDWWHGVPGGN